jgi:hypothetical protein
MPDLQESMQQALLFIGLWLEIIGTKFVQQHDIPV